MPNVMVQCERQCDKQINLSTPTTRRLSQPKYDTKIIAACFAKPRRISRAQRLSPPLSILAFQSISAFEIYNIFHVHVCDYIYNQSGEVDTHYSNLIVIIS